MLKINGKDESSYIGKTVSEYIKSADYKQSALAVELNSFQKGLWHNSFKRQWCFRNSMLYGWRLIC